MVVVIDPFKIVGTIICIVLVVGYCIAYGIAWLLDKRNERK